VICDLVHQDGRLVEFTPRNVLRKVVAAYDKRGLRQRGRLSGAFGGTVDHQVAGSRPGGRVTFICWPK